MTWTKLDDGIFDHPKMVKAGEDAANLYVRALVYCNRYLTDGRVEAEVLCVLTRKPDAEKLVEALVRVGAWEAHPDGGWSVHNFHEHNPTAEQVEARRAEISEKRARAGKVGGKRSGEARSNEAKLKQHALDGAKQNEAPTRPDPTHPDQRESDARAPDVRCPTTEPAAKSATDPAEVLASMRAASSGLVADPTTTSAGELVAVKRAVDALLSRGVALDVIVRGAAHLAHGHWTQRSKRSVITAGRLVEERDGRGSILGELLADADGCVECRPAKMRQTPSLMRSEPVNAPPPVPAKPSPLMMRLAAEARERQAQRDEDARRDAKGVA